jgi:hypothetical protein
VSEARQKRLTKTQRRLRRLRARSVRNYLRFFISYQDGWMQGHLKEQGRDPEMQGLGMLLLAKEELDALVEEMTAEAAAGPDR